ncbi:MAG TPA: hypothetical protein PKD98_30560 [Anaerolineae bacterium]|nr:hypothetical protein [Anaerolineae bacterium]
MEVTLREWPAHDLTHTVQAERAVMQPSFRAADPSKTASATIWPGRRSATARLRRAAHSLSWLPRLIAPRP